MPNKGGAGMNNWPSLATNTLRNYNKNEDLRRARKEKIREEAYLNSPAGQQKTQEKEAKAQEEAAKRKKAIKYDTVMGTVYAVNKHTCPNKEIEECKSCDESGCKDKQPNDVTEDDIQAIKVGKCAEHLKDDKPHLHQCFDTVIGENFNTLIKNDDTEENKLRKCAQYFKDDPEYFDKCVNAVSSPTMGGKAKSRKNKKSKSKKKSKKAKKAKKSTRRRKH